MKIRFIPLNCILLFGSLFFINYKLIQVDVPGVYVTIFSVLYGLVFPFKVLIIEENKEDGTDDND